MLLIVFVPEADVAELHMPSNRRQLNRIRRVVQVGRDLQHLHEALESSHALLIEPAKIDQLLDGVDEDRNTEQIGHQIGEIQRTLHNRDGAKDDDGDGDELAEPDQSAGKVRIALVLDPAAGEKTLVGGGELARLHLLVGERLDHADARQRVFELRVDVADAILAVA